MAFLVDKGSHGEKQMRVGNGYGDGDKCHGRYNGFYQGGPEGVVMVNVDQSGQNSDSNSEGSATDSVANTRTNNNSTNLSSSEENENACEKIIINMPFIDFLGVGV